MDFHSLPRRELQALCKKNRIPANMTNVAMADALQSLFAVGGMETIEEALQNQSPKNVQASSTYLTRSSRRISARRAAAATASDDPREQPASPLPRARRVTAMDSETGRLFSEEVDRDEEQKEGMMEITPMAKPSTKKQPRGTTTARNTRRRATKKEDGEAAEEGLIEAAKTPATRNGRRTTARNEAESPAVVDEGTEDTVVSSRTTTRRTRQSSKSIPVDVTATTLRRSSRARARVSAPDMESLARDVQEQAEKGIEIKKSVDTDGDSMIPPPCKKGSDLAAGNVTDLKEIQDKTVIDGDNCEQDCNPVVADSDLSQHYHSSEVKEDGVVPETEGVDGAKDGDSWIASCKKTSDLAEGNTTDLREAEEIQDNTLIGGANCEQDCNPVVVGIDLPQHQHSSEIKNGIVSETEGLDDVKDGASCKKTSDLAEGNATDLKEAEEIQDNTLIGGENCEQDCRPVVVDIDLSQHQHSSDIKEDGIVSETKGLDDVKDGASCKKTLDLAEGNATDLKEAEGIQDNTLIGGENCEQDCRPAVVVDIDLPQHQHSSEIKEDGIVSETEGLDDVKDGASCKKTSDLAEGNATDLKEAEGIQDNTLIGGENCEQDCRPVVVDIDLSQHQHSSDIKEDGIVSETEGLDDVKDGDSLIASCKKTSDLATETEGIQDETIIDGENCERDCNLVVVDTDPSQHQHSPEVEEDGFVPETGGLNDVNELEIAAQQHDVETGVETMDLVDRDDAFLLLSDEKPSDLAAGNASHLCSMDSQEEILPREICEQDCNVAVDITNLVASLLLSDDKSSDFAAANASHLDSQEKLEKESDGDQEEILPSEICEQDCNVAVDITNLPLHQLVADPEEPEGFNVESSPKIEEGCEGEQMANHADDTNLPLHQLAVEPKEPEGFNAELSPQMEGGREEEQMANPADRESSVLEGTPLISSLGNPDITGDAKAEQSKGGEEETEGEMQTTVAEVVAFSPPQQQPTSLQSSKTVDLPAESLPEVGDLIGDSEVSPDEVTVEAVEASKLAKTSSPEVADMMDGHPADGKNSAGALMTAGIIVEAEKSENQKESDADKEKKSFGQLTMTEIGCGEVKVESDAEKQSLAVVDLKNMSLRKLKLLYKEKKSNANATNKVEGTRVALAELNENVL